MAVASSILDLEESSSVPSEELLACARICRRTFEKLSQGRLWDLPTETLEAFKEEFQAISEACMTFEITASAEEYQAALKGEVDFPGISHEDLEEARTHLKEFVRLSLEAKGVEVPAEIQQKMVNILLLTIKKA